jgi:hypothetical protein
MGIYKTINNLKVDAGTINSIKSVGIGSIQLYNEKSDIEYPYCNFDIISSKTIGNFVKEYSIRVYVIDRNEPYIAFNKCELALKTLMDYIQLESFVINYFTLDFKDNVNGVYADIIVDGSNHLQCINYDEKGYITLENGDLISKYLLNEIGGKLPLEN